jgi:hypothetical protein
MQQEVMGTEKLTAEEQRNRGSTQRKEHVCRWKQLPSNKDNDREH